MLIAFRNNGNTMPSIRQKRAARIILQEVENLANGNEVKTGGDIVDASGYGKSMRLYPGRILESKGVRAELKNLGFSVEAADSVVWNLMHKSKSDKVKISAAQEMYKRLGAYEDTRQGATKNIHIAGNTITFQKFAK
jgi:hypothetical protein